MKDEESIDTMQTWVDALVALENGELVEINSKTNRRKEAGWIPLQAGEFVWHFLENFHIRIVEQKKEWVNLYSHPVTDDVTLGTKRYSSKKEAIMEGRGSSLYTKTMRLTDD